MYVEKITYTDFNGTERTEELYFNLSRADVIKLERSHPGGFLDAITDALKNNDNVAIFDMLQEIIVSAYGEKSEDGRRFIKSAALAEEFKETAAFDAMLDKFLEQPDLMNTFIQGVFPKVSDEQIAQAKAMMEEQTGIAIPDAEAVTDTTSAATDTTSVVNEA